MGANYLKSKINENFVDSVNIGKKKVANYDQNMVEINTNMCVIK